MSSPSTPMSASPSPSTSALIEHAKPPSGSSHERSNSSVSPSKRIPLKRQQQAQQQRLQKLGQRPKEAVRHDIELLSDSSSDDEQPDEPLLQWKRRASQNNAASTTAKPSSARAGPTQASKAPASHNPPGRPTKKNARSSDSSAESDESTETSGSNSSSSSATPMMERKRRLSKETLKTKKRKTLGSGKRADAEDSDIPASKAANAGVASTVQKNASTPKLQWQVSRNQGHDPVGGSHIAGKGNGKRKSTGKGDEDEVDEALSCELSSVTHEGNTTKEKARAPVTQQRVPDDEPSSTKSAATARMHPARLKSKKSDERLCQDDSERRFKKKKDSEGEGVDQSAITAGPTPTTMSAKHQKYSTGLALNVASKPPAKTTPGGPALLIKVPVAGSGAASATRDAPSTSSGAVASIAQAKPSPKQALTSSFRPQNPNELEVVTPTSAMSTPSKTKTPKSTALSSKPSAPVTSSTASAACSTRTGMTSSTPNLSQMRRIPKSVPTQQSPQQDPTIETDDQGLASNSRLAGTGKPSATNHRPETSRRVSSSAASDFRFTLKEEAITGYSLSGRSKVDDRVDLAEPVFIGSRDDAVAFIDFALARNWFRSRKRLFLKIETTADPEDPRSSMSLATIASRSPTSDNYLVSAFARPAPGPLTPELRRHLTAQGEYAATMLLIRAILTPHKGLLDVTKLLHSAAHDSSLGQEDVDSFVDRLQKEALIIWHDYREQHPRHHLVKLMPRIMNLGEKDVLLVCDQLIELFENGCATTAKGSVFLGFGSWAGKLGQDILTCTRALIQFAEGKPAYWKKVEAVLTRLGRLCISDGSQTATSMYQKLNARSLEARHSCAVAERRYTQEGKAWPEPRIANPATQPTQTRASKLSRPHSPPAAIHAPSKPTAGAATSSFPSTSYPSTSTATPIQSSVDPIAPGSSAVGQGTAASTLTSTSKAAVFYAPLRPLPLPPPEERKSITRPAANDPRLAKRYSIGGSGMNASKPDSALERQFPPIVGPIGAAPPILDGFRHASPAVIGQATEYVSDVRNGTSDILLTVGKNSPARFLSAPTPAPTSTTSVSSITPGPASVALPDEPPSTGRRPSLSTALPDRPLKRLKLMASRMTSPSDVPRRASKLPISEEIEPVLGSPLSSAASRDPTPVTGLCQTSLSSARRETPVNTPTSMSGSPTAPNVHASSNGRAFVAPPRAPRSSSVIKTNKEAGSLRPLISGPFYHEVVGHLLEPVDVHLLDSKRMWSKQFVLDDPQIFGRLRELNREDTDLDATELPLRARGVFRRDPAADDGLEDVLWPADITLSVATGPSGSWERTCPVTVTDIVPGINVDTCPYFDLTPYLALGHNAFIIAKLGSVRFPPGLRFSIEVCTSFSAGHARRQIKEEEDEDKTFELYEGFKARAMRCDSVKLSLADPRAPTKRIDLPVRGLECEHLETFDFKTHLASSTKDDWKCPFDHTLLQGSDIGCSKFCPPSKLWICHYTLDNVLKGVPEDAVDVFIEAGASQVKAEEAESPIEP
ncbi:hypothetical protein MVLG_00168 [Microbotryum lychnidis-dioicae p1A1 Lamole]|uniref:SP-RING-type domain-containing protein n=1 Tax=Microbotryum lychnidis-dioicae (strain p1A1 Lamole / MvSl-1064) TaxID=683840 RepID=U5GY99_USTV1|nr:hypothetical protein MVLG_00168 [Microbotryum lychnidis-dioicae p1A1 Lamole]|eukprot:KDE09768.1 hypothetical protein MVLG_00168 [Microbotryum lychnidis-dioicae p1A1 Lamole]